MCCAYPLRHVQIFVTPWTAACQVPQSLGILQARILERLSCSPPGDLPYPGMEPRSPTLQVDSLPSEPPGMPKNTGVGSLSLLQGIFSTRNRTCIAGKPSFLYGRLIIQLLCFSPQNFVEDKRAYHLVVIMYIIMLILLQCTLGILKYTRGTK